jgi:N-acetylneuraminate synthase
LTVRIGVHEIEQYGTCYVIAEAGSNHDGKLTQALDLIDVAAAAGADAVKFQLFRVAELYPPNCGVVDTPMGAHDFFELLSGLELPMSWLPALKARAEQQGIAFLATPFDVDAADALAALDVAGLKIASPELSHLPLLAHVARLGLPLILSTGMATMGDIEEALDTVGPGTPTILLHCVSGYPTPPPQANLRTISGLHSAFERPVGLSDHTLDAVAAPVVAAALGAPVLEKHFTLSRNLDGPDHSFSVEPDELVQMIESVRGIERCPVERRLEFAESVVGAATVDVLLGSSRKQLAPVERELAAVDRRSLHARRDIAVGDVLTDENVGVLRGERNLIPGLHPRELLHVIGARATRAIESGQGITWSDLLAR